MPKTPGSDRLAVVGGWSEPVNHIAGLAPHPVAVVGNSVYAGTGVSFGDPLNSVGAIHDHVNMLKSDGSLNGLGLIFGTILMLLFTVLNLMGAKLLSESNSVITARPVSLRALASSFKPFCPSPWNS